MMQRTIKWWLLGLAVMLLAGGVSAQEPAEGRKRLVANELEGDLLEVHFLDIGQGDAFYIRTPGGKHYLLDTGPRSAHKRIVPYLKYLQVEKLDAVVITHSHDDHAGSLFHLSDQIPIGVVYSSGYFHSSKHNLKTLRRLEEKKIEVKKLRAGDELTWDEGVKLQVIHPPSEWDGERKDPNAMSVAIKLTFGEIDFLLMGDSEKRDEREILARKLDLKSEFLKVGHHGSDTSSSDSFIDAVSPLYAIVSVGAGNRFNHPHVPTLDGLRKRDITVLRTDELGTIGVYTDGKRIMIKIKGKDWQPVSLLLRGVPGRRLSFIAYSRGGSHVA